MNLAVIEQWCLELLVTSGISAPWYVVPAAGGVMLVGLVFVLTRVLRRRRLNAALTPRYRNARGRTELLAAQKAEKAKRLFDAAGHYARAGQVDKAVTLYVQEGKITKAAETLIAADRPEEAADQYRQAAKWQQAGELYKQVKNHRRAGECFDQAQMPGPAATAWEFAGELVLAGERYHQLGNHAKAARAFEQAGEGARFVDSFVPWWEAELEAQAGCLEPASYWLSALEHAADAALQHEMWEPTLKLSAYLSRWHPAGQAAEALGRWEDAKRFYQSAKDLDGVARMAEKLGVNHEAAVARGEAAEKAGNYDEAARYYEQAERLKDALPLYMQAEKWEEAARVAETLGQREDAANAWGKAGQHRKVADIYFELGRWDPAAAAYEASGDLELAAEAYRKAENWLSSARVWETIGNTQAAIQDLQQQLRRVGQDRSLSLKLVELMMLEGMRGTALGILEPMVSMQPNSDTDADILYKYGMLLEEDGRNADAAKAYERLLAYDVAYRDARARAEHVKALPDRQSLSGSQSGSSTQADPFAPAGGFAPVAKEDDLLTQGGSTQKILDRYIPKGELGRGGMGIVIKAHDKMLDRLVAIKLVKVPDVGTGKLDRILSEARATAKLNHPNIVQIYDCALAQGNFLMAMEYIQGQTVKELIAEQGALPVNALVVIFGQIAKALQYAHQNGIVHRDVKPANILWTEDKQIKITDFGLARAAQELANTQTVVVGSPYYMAPEQLMGELMDHRVDIYALGVSLYEAAVGELPFPKGDVGYHHVHSEAPDPLSKRPDLPEPLARLIVDMLAKDPDARPADCGVVLQRLRDAVQK